MNEDGQASCLACPAGYGSPQASQLCNECPVGTFGKQGICENCNGRFFGDKPGLSKCKSCPRGLRSDGKQCFETISSESDQKENPIKIISVSITRMVSNISVESVSLVSWKVEATPNNKLEDFVGTFEIDLSTSPSGSFEQILHSWETDDASRSMELLNLSTPLWRQVYFARVRALADWGVNSDWQASIGWQTADDCSRVGNFFLEDTTRNSNVLLEDPTKFVCRPCPTGVSCDGEVRSNTIVPLNGYWAGPMELALEDRYITCIHANACLGAYNPNLETSLWNEQNQSLHNASGCNMELGFRLNSVLCRQCRPNFRRSGADNCYRCPQEEQNGIFLMLGVVAMLGVLALFVFINLDDAGHVKPSDGISKSLLDHLQVVSLFVAFPLQWPSALRSMFAFQGVMSTAGQHIVNPDCMLDQHTSEVDIFYSKQIFFAVVPIIVCICVGLGWRTYSCLTSKSWDVRPVDRPRKEAASTGTNDSGSSPSLTDMDTDTDTAADVTAGGAVAGTATVGVSASPKDKMIVSLLAILFLLYPTLCQQGFRLLDCRRVGELGLYLSSALEEPCYSPRHLSYLFGVGLPGLIFYIIGLPAGGLLVLNFSKKITATNTMGLYDPGVRIRYGFFYSLYKHNRWYWEGVVVLRKTFIVMLSQLSSSIPLKMQILLVLLILLVCLLLEIYCEPFAIKTSHHEILRKTVVGALVGSWLTMWLGALLFELPPTDDSDYAGQTITTVVVVGGNIVLIAWFVGHFLRHKCILEKGGALPSYKGAPPLLHGMLAAGAQKDLEGQTDNELKHHNSLRRILGTQLVKKPTPGATKVSTGGIEMIENPAREKRSTVVDDGGDNVWVRHWDESEESHFNYNTQTGESVWELDDNHAEVKINEMFSSELPEGWTRSEDSEGDVFYVDSEGNSQWEKPVE